MKLSKDQKTVLIHRIAVIAERLRQAENDRIKKADTFVAKHDAWQKARMAYIYAAVKKDPTKYLELSESAWPRVDQEAIKAIDAVYVSAKPEPQRPASHRHEHMPEVSFPSLAGSDYRGCGLPSVGVPKQHVKSFKDLSDRLDSAILAGNGEELVGIIVAFEAVTEG